MMKRPNWSVAKASHGQWEFWFAWYPVRVGRDLGRGLRSRQGKLVLLRRVRRRWASGPTAFPNYTDYDLDEIERLAISEKKTTLVLTGAILVVAIIVAMTFGSRWQPTRWAGAVHQELVRIVVSLMHEATGVSAREMGDGHRIQQLS